MKIISLGELFELRYGKSLRKDKRIHGSVPVYGSNGLVDYHCESLVSEPTLIIGRKGSIGEVHLVSTPCWPIDTTYFVETLGKYNYDLEWLYRLLRTLNLQNLNRSAAIPGLNRDDVYRIKILFPPLADQKRIAHLLGKVEGLIARRKQHLQQLDDLLKSFFLEMFGDPVRNEKGWEKKPLARLGNLDRGVSKHRPRNAPELLGGKYPLIQTGDVSNAGTYITGFTQTYSEIGLAQSKLWPTGTLCITIAANIAQTGILTFNACFPDSVVGFSSDKNASNPLYVLGLFWFFQRILEKNAPAAAQKNINLKILRELEVPAPPTDLQNQFAAIVEKIEGLKSRYQQSLTDLENLYGALSQKAFKGELDLSRVPLPTEAPDKAEEQLRQPEPVALDIAEQIQRFSMLDLPAMSSKDSRRNMLKQWFDEWLNGATASEELSPEGFWERARISALDYQGEDDETNVFSSEDYDLFKDWLFSAIESGLIGQTRNTVEGEEGADFGNRVILRKAD
jgi:type I restriction enzyme, S subunit